MNKILTKEVSFELAKFLKEIGYNIYQPKQYNGSNNNLYNYTEEQCKLFGDVYYAPTIADMVDYIYTNTKKWISVYRYRDHAADANDDFTYKHSFSNKEFNTQIEAYEHAIRFIYENKI